MGDVYDLQFKFIVIGDAGVGKSCILHRFIENKFKKESHTIGVEFGSKIIDLGGKLIKLQIWDTAGQERFRSVTRSYYRGSAGVILVYDVTNRESFYHTATWLDDARKLTANDIVILLVGNKIDLTEEREVPFLEASRFAQENNLVFLETSAFTGEGVDEVFLKCARSILTKINTGAISPTDLGSGVAQLREGSPSASSTAGGTTAVLDNSSNNTSNDSGCTC